MAFSVPPPVRTSIFKAIEGMEPMTDRFFSNPRDSIKVIASRVKAKNPGRRFMTAVENKGTRIWRFE